MQQATSSDALAPRPGVWLVEAASPLLFHQRPGSLSAPGPLCFLSMLGSCFALEALMKITVTALKPRNPLVAAALHRQAGSHRRGPGAQRQLTKRELQRELLKERHPDT